jgi:hypothetical protein
VKNSEKMKNLMIEKKKLEKEKGVEIVKGAYQKSNLTLKGSKSGEKSNF